MKKQDDSGRCSIMACCIEVEKEFMNVLYNSLWVDFVFYFFIWKFVFLSGFSYLFLNSCLKLLLQINTHTFYLSWKFCFFFVILFYRFIHRIVYSFLFLYEKKSLLSIKKKYVNVTKINILEENKMYIAHVNVWLEKGLKSTQMINILLWNHILDSILSLCPN